MKSVHIISTLRKRHFRFQGLPDTIRIPAMGAQREEVVKPTAEATVDDLAFALQALEGESEALYSRLSSVRALLSLARQNGACGADVAAAAIAAGKEIV